VRMFIIMVIVVGDVLSGDDDDDDVNIGDAWLVDSWQRAIHLHTGWIVTLSTYDCFHVWYIMMSYVICHDVV
jgi:hypothetical protein